MTNNIEWKTSQALVSYPDAMEQMEARVEQIIAHQASELVWFLEHPPLYTGGTSAKIHDLLDGKRYPVYPTRRGGQYTYHGPGQRIAYVMLDLRQREQDVRKFVYRMEEWMIRSLAEFDVTGERREGRVGIWVVLPSGKEAKIGAIGVHIRKWVTSHGLALNVHPNLTDFSAIVPCGIQEHGVTSLHDLGVKVTLEEVDVVLRRVFGEVFV